MSVEVCDLLLYDGLCNINTFLKNYERQVPKYQRLLALDQAQRDTPSRWWGNHKKNIGD